MCLNHEFVESASESQWQLCQESGESSWVIIFVVFYLEDSTKDNIIVGITHLHAYTVLARQRVVILPFTQCSRLKSSMPFKRDLDLQNMPLKATLQNATPN